MVNGKKWFVQAIVYQLLSMKQQRTTTNCYLFHFSVRSPQWLRSKWWALKKHVPENEATTFEGIASKVVIIYYKFLFLIL